MGPRVLIIEDERAIADSISYTLRREGYDARPAYDGEAGLRLADEFRPDLVILDLMLPGVDGLSVCRTLRRKTMAPIIMLTAKAGEVDRVVGLEVGADDYVTKPFSMRELVARVRANLRRQEMTGAPAAPGAGLPAAGFSDEHLTLELEKPAITAGGKPVALSPRELRLLKVLLAHRGRVRTRPQLLDEAWGEDEFVAPRTVDVHVRWLRQKLEPDPEHPRYIETVRGIGYRFGK